MVEGAASRSFGPGSWVPSLVVPAARVDHRRAHVVPHVTLHATRPAVSPDILLTGGLLCVICAFFRRRYGDAAAALLGFGSTHKPFAVSRHLSVMLCRPGLRCNMCPARQSPSLSPSILHAVFGRHDLADCAHVCRVDASCAFFRWVPGCV